MMKTYLAAAALALGLSPDASAQGVPTIDLSSLAKLTDQLVEAKLQLKEQIAANVKLDDQTLKLIEQVQLLQSQISALKDGLTLADLGVDPETFLKNILPQFADLGASLAAAKTGNWSQVLSGGTLGGGPVGTRVEQTFASAGMNREQVEGLGKSEKPATARIGTQANVNAFLSVAAESSSQQARESLTRIDRLVTGIEGTKNLKQAIDLNTRVTAELGIALGNLWAMEAVQTVGMGEAGVMDAATAAEEEKFLQIEMEN
ncbi:type IV secretion system protein [Paracoccus sp. CPCC 101403]|uniref:Type IV secretion system protein n=1 Tax=Paracoccus broussonetiae TaxID=3075834 RepID=A0ABU3EKD3_9RHOB|nr:type IV secretion system protein [Paracoccus sp. CPCC 101403]MDT1064689.1 type IV secretion system protein [Paracoccus sp. CPCC 101403]